MKKGILLVLMPALLAMASCNKTNGADQIIYGNFVTMDEKRESASAVAIKDGKILAVGDKSDVEKYKVGNTKIHQYNDNKYIYPGFVDAHSHVAIMTTLLCGGHSFSSAGVKPSGAAYESGDYEAYAEIMKDFMDKHPGRPVYQGMGLWLKEKDGRTEYPTAAMLDEKLGDSYKDTPVVIVGAGGHDCWLNTAAINKFVGDTPEKQQTFIDSVGKDCVITDATGKIQGYFVETARFKITDQIPHDKEEVKKTILGLQDAVIAKGYTTMCDCSIVENEFNQQISAFEELEKEGKLKIKFRAYYEITEYSDDKTREESFKKAVEYSKKFKGDHFQVIGIKIFLDGVYEALTSYTLKPYTEAAGKGDKYYGIGRWKDKEDLLKDIVKEANQNGLAIHFHAMGDAAMRQGLKAFEQAADEMGIDGTPNFRNAIGHCGFVDCAKKQEEEGRCKGLTDIQKFAKLGVSAVVAPQWTPVKPTTWATENKTLGKNDDGSDRANELYKIQSYIDTGANVAFHTDSGCFAGAKESIFDATTRLDGEHIMDCDRIRGVEELVDAEQALKCMTVNAAYVARSEDHVGCIKEGMDADFVVYNKDFTKNEIAADYFEYLDTRLIASYIDGQEVYPNDN